MAIAVPQYFPQENCISWVGMKKLLFIVYNLHKALSTDISSIPWFICTSIILSLSLPLSLFLSLAHTFSFCHFFFFPWRNSYWSLSSLRTFVPMFEMTVNNADLNNSLHKHHIQVRIKNPLPSTFFFLIETRFIVLGGKITLLKSKNILALDKQLPKASDVDDYII